MKKTSPYVTKGHRTMADATPRYTKKIKDGASGSRPTVGTASGTP